MPRQAAFTFVVKAAFLFDDDILAAMLYEVENTRR